WGRVARSTGTCPERSSERCRRRSAGERPGEAGAVRRRDSEVRGCEPKNDGRNSASQCETALGGRSSQDWRLWRRRPSWQLPCPLGISCRLRPGGRRGGNWPRVGFGEEACRFVRAAPCQVLSPKKKRSI